MAESRTSVTDRVEAALVECLPETPPRVTLPTPPDTSPTARAAEATIEQTGADPPPEG